MLLDLLGAKEVAVPDHSIICRRRRSISFRPPPRRAGPISIAIGATGVMPSTPGPWTKDKYGDTRRAKFVKLHVAIDVTTGELVAAVVTDAAGEGHWRRLGRTRLHRRGSIWRATLGRARGPGL